MQPAETPRHVIHVIHPVLMTLLRHELLFIFPWSMDELLDESVTRPPLVMTCYDHQNWDELRRPVGFSEESVNWWLVFQLPSTGIQCSLAGGWATPLKNMNVSLGMIRNPIYGKIKNGNQTTNQFLLQQLSTLRKRDIDTSKNSDMPAGKGFTTMINCRHIRSIWVAG